MKTKLIILCTMVFAVILCETISSSFEINAGRNAVDAKYDHKDNRQIDEVTDFEILELVPVTSKKTGITVTNSITGEEVKAWPTRMYVENTDKDASGSMLTELTLPLFAMFLVEISSLIAAIVCFIWFITSVSRGDIFGRGNVRKLNVMGLCLILFAAIESYSRMSGMASCAGTFGMDGYSVNYISGVCFIPLLLGTVAFVFAQIFAMATKLKEEQELTI